MRELVELHGGLITVASRENEGSTFQVSIPVLQCPSSLVHIPTPTPPNPPRSLRRATVERPVLAPAALSLHLSVSGATEERARRLSRNSGEQLEVPAPVAADATRLSPRRTPSPGDSAAVADVERIPLKSVAAVSASLREADSSLSLVRLVLVGTAASAAIRTLHARALF